MFKLKYTKDGSIETIYGTRQTVSGNTEFLVWRFCWFWDSAVYYEPLDE